MIRILTDTSANLPKEITDRLGIAVIPMYYYDNDAEFSCMDIDAFDDTGYYTQIKKGRKITTSQITPQRYYDFMEPYIEAGEDLIYVGMSGGISGSFSASETAALELKERWPERFIACVDSRGASLGEGIIAVRAAELAKDCTDPAALVKTLDGLCDRMYQVFIVDDLMHLRRTGRLCNAGAIVGTLLNIKPVLKGDEAGRIVNFMNVRGRKKAIAELARRYEAFAENAEEQTVGIAHAMCMEDAEALKEMILKVRPPKAVQIVKYEPVTGSHVGPGALALFFMGAKDVRSK